MEDKSVLISEAELVPDGQASESFFCDDCPTGVPIVGRSPAMARTLRTIRLVAESRCNPVLILGETGTGKELAAQAVHAWRCGQADNLVAINCAALTANLLESELFGHEKGSFTGADRDKTGLFEAAGRGTIFLDEISEMPLDLQAKFLRVLQERTFRKVGGTKDIRCNATVIASSNRNLRAEVAEGRFRQDLYYRLTVFPVVMPALRDPDRRQDVPVLAEFFLRTSDISPGRRMLGLRRQATDKLFAHDWPGNVRELRNVIDRAIIVEKGDYLSAESILIHWDELAGCGPLPSSTEHAQALGKRPVSKDLSDFSLETAEREFILRALRETGWQRTRAASLLGITRATLLAKLKRYDIQSPDTGASPAVPNDRLQGISAG